MTPLLHRFLIAAALVLASHATLASEKNKDTITVKAYQATTTAWDKRDAKAISASYDSQGTFLSPSTGGPLSGPALTAYLQSLFAAVPDFKVDIVQTDILGDGRIADQWVVRGTWTQPFLGGPLAGAQPTGKSFVLKGASFHDMDGTKVRSTVQYWDQVSFLTQLGLIQPK